MTNKKRRRPFDRHRGNQENENNQIRRLCFNICCLVTTSLLLTPNNESSYFCQAFCPRGSTVSRRHRPGVQFRGERAYSGRVNTSPSLDVTELPSSSFSSKPETLLSQSIQLTLSQIEQFAKFNGISLNSHEEDILKGIHQQQQIDAQTMASALPPEEEPSAGVAAITDSTRKNNVPYQWLSSEQTEKPLAIQTKGQILKDSTIAWIREKANSVWNGRASSSEGTLESRFTYQRKGNYEVHLADLLMKMQEDSNNNKAAKSEIYEALQERIYPLVREAFGTSLGEKDPSSLRFCVYDAIVIRYNATEADLQYEKESSILVDSSTTMGAGQPLHRDLGLVSVNVMLNSPDEFDGGGTFMEHQLQDLLFEETDGTHDAHSRTENQRQGSIRRLPLPLKPIGGPGHALLHLSSDRHAGASTKRGVRDILVFFLTASKTKTAAFCDDDSIPLLEQAARLKSKARAQCEECQVTVDEGINPTATIWQPLASAFCRAKHQHLAVQSVPTDGEAWQYLGMALWDIHQALGRLLIEQQQSGITERTMQNAPEIFRYQQSLVQESISVLETAREFTPCDARVYHNLAWILDQQQAARTTVHVDHSIQHHHHHHEKIKSHYSRAMELHQAFQKVGCDVGIDYDSTILNYGLYLANKDLFAEALSVLEWIEPSALQVIQQMQQQTQQQEQKLQQRFGLIQDAQRLLSFCRRQLS